MSAAENRGIVMLADIAMRKALCHGRARPEQAPREKGREEAHDRPMIKATSNTPRRDWVVSRARTRRNTSAAVSTRHYTPDRSSARGKRADEGRAKDD